MKKNKMMRAASALLVAVLLTTSVISGTFAKYVTEKTGFDTARVAKFGVEITAATDMFYSSYEDTFKTYEANEQTAEIRVQADSSNTDVVAPGTNGKLAGFAVTGTPEVDVRVTYDATLELTNWVVDGDEYMPLVFKVNGKEYKICSETANIASLIAAVEEAIEKSDAVYHTNTDLSVVNDDVTVEWAWPFSTGDFNDAKDTKLGNAAVGDNAATVKLTVKTTIEQLD